MRWGECVDFDFTASIVESGGLTINGGGDDVEEEERDLVKACLKVSIPALNTPSCHDLLDIIIGILVTENEDVIPVGKWRSQYYPTFWCSCFLRCGGGVICA